MIATAASNWTNEQLQMQIISVRQGTTASDGFCARYNCDYNCNFSANTFQRLQLQVQTRVLGQARKQSQL